MRSVFMFRLAVVRVLLAVARPAGFSNRAIERDRDRAAQPDSRDDRIPVRSLIPRDSGRRFCRHARRRCETTLEQHQGTGDSGN